MVLLLKQSFSRDASPVDPNMWRVMQMHDYIVVLFKTDILCTYLVLLPWPFLVVLTKINKCLMITFGTRGKHTNLGEEFYLSLQPILSLKSAA